MSSCSSGSGGPPPAQCQGHRAGLLVAFIHLKQLTMLTFQGGYESEEKGDKIGPGGDFGVYR